MRAGHLKSIVLVIGAGSRGGEQPELWLERPVLGSHLSCVAASYLKVTNLGRPQPSELARKVCLIITFSPCTYVVMSPWCLLSQKRELIFALCISKVLLYSSNQDRAQRTAQTPTIQSIPGLIWNYVNPDQTQAYKAKAQRTEMGL